MTGRIKRILIVEDQPELLDSYAELVEAAGFVALKALDGYNGLDMLAKGIGQIDLVLLDLMMPGIDGIEVLKTIKNNEEKYGNMPVIILTNMTSRNVIQDTFSNGGSAYLVKADLNYQDLMKELDKFLG